MTLPSNVKTVADAISYLTADNAAKAAQIVALQGRAAALESKVPAPIAAPVVTTPAAISSDGTPQVGEQLTGVDPVGNYPVSGRRWLSGSTFLTDLKTFTAEVAGNFIYEGTITAPDGRTATSRSTIAVAAKDVPPAPQPAMKLLANPAPAEPEAQPLTGSKVTSDFILSPVENYDVDVIGVTAGQSWAIQVAGNNAANGDASRRRVWLENRGNGRLALFYNDAQNAAQGISDINYAFVQAFADASEGKIDIRIRRETYFNPQNVKVNRFRIFIGAAAIENNTPQLTGVVANTEILAEGNNFVRVFTTYNNVPMYESGTVKPTSLVTDRLILSKTAISSLGVFSADADYYLPAADNFTIEVRSLQGEVVVPAAPYAILANPEAGKASLKSPFAIPATRKGSRVQVVSRALESAGVIDVVEMTYPNETQFGQNVSSLFSAGRARRVFSNMLVQSYWQNAGGANGSHGGYDIYGRNVPGVSDNLGMPLRAGLWCWYPLPDQQNEQVTLQLKYTGGAGFNIVHEGLHNKPEQGVKQIGPMVRIDANTVEWTITADRTTGTGLERSGNFRITSLDPNDPPKNMSLCIKGVDNLAYRFCQSFIDKLKLIRGRLRFMDDIGVNGALYAFGGTYDWSKRAKQTGIVGSLAIEDMIELCNRSNRPLFWNVEPGFAYETGGLDYYDRTMDMLYYGTGAEFQSPGFTAPNGVVKHIAPEIGNENWNFGFGGKGTYYYLLAAGSRAGLVPAYSEGNGSQNASGVTTMRNIIQALLMSRLEARIPTWRERTIRVFGGQFGLGDMANQAGDSYWPAASQHIDEVVRAPYIPNDPNAGGQAAAYSDRTPAGICTFLKSSVAGVGADLAAMAAQSIAMGFSHGIYEVNVAIVSLGLTLQQNIDLHNSPEWKALWKNDIIPMLTSQGGYIDLYSDCANIYDGNIQQWGVEHIPGHPTINGAMEAVEEYEAAARAAANTMP